MRSTNLRRWPLAVALLGSATPLAAQIDYRNLDDDRPVVTEDAYPTEFRAFEFLLPYAFERARGGGDVHALIPEIEYGILRNAAIGVKLPIAAVVPGGADEWRVSGGRIFALYNLNTEGRRLPAFSARADLLLPIGSLGGRSSRVGLKAIATRSWGRMRLHGNAAWTLGSDPRPAAVEAGPRWSYSLAADRTLFRQSTLLIGEVVALRPIPGAPVQVNAGVGLRYQWTPTSVIDAGLRRRIRDATGPDLAVTLGFSHAFAFTGLMPRGAGR